ncbi:MULTISPECIES: hypothetical protein [unclassified Pseudomonas]|uniref:hypothetical protein n=1 Tax=unclassified Pseudomonas TaxID=196821 RepID=UPI001475CAA1|nr:MULTISPECIES: hypothetical protein [unclassified Pseudomonas]NMY37132.1 hypothetical protein [Pseudomonas sp. WS 5078]NMY59873.1 hypothetical protein [Pseudomonas sp. WS 5354]
MKTHVNTENYKPFIPTINWGQALCLGAFALVMSGCSVTTPKTFTFQADVPEDFTVTGTGNYIPAPGETCTGRSGKPSASVVCTSSRNSQKRPIKLNSKCH